MTLDDQKDAQKKKIFDDQIQKLKDQYAKYLQNYSIHPIYQALITNSHMDPNVIEEWKKILDLGYFDEYISEDENEFEV